MNPILKTLLIHRSNEQGFTVPVVVLLGLIMILLSSITIFKSQAEVMTALTQRESARALYAAEAGVTQYRKLIARNRVIAINPKSIWSTTANTCDSSTYINDKINTYQNLSTTENLGQYKLKDYVYSQASGLGTLTVEGKFNEAIAQIIVEIPIRAERSDPNNGTLLKPALWLASSSVTNIGNLKVDTGNIVVTQSSCTLPAQPTSTNLLNPNTQYIIADSRLLVPTPDLPAGNNFSNCASNTNSIVNCITNAQLASVSELPRSTDKKDPANNYYHYIVTDSLVLSNKNLEINPGTKVILYVNGNITFDGNVTVNTNNGSPFLEIYGNVNPKYGNANTEKIQFNGNRTININAFIHAPQATVSKADNANNATVQLNGAMWVNNWNYTSSLPATTTIKLDVRDVVDTTTTPSTTTSYSAYLFYSSTQNLPPKPLIYPPSSWKTEEVSP